MKHDRLTGRPRKDEAPDFVPPAKRPPSKGMIAPLRQCSHPSEGNQAHTTVGFAGILMCERPLPCHLLTVRSLTYSLSAICDHDMLLRYL